MSASTSNTKQKKVRYEVGTKGSSSHHHHRSSSSRDSGVGSSSASDRASLGTTPASNPSGFSSQQIETQRHNLRAVTEALDAANEKIQKYEASTAKLNALLSESNKENRLLKKEKAELCNRVEDLEDDLADEKKRVERMRRESHSSSSRNSPPRSSPRSSPRNSREIEAAAASSFRESTRRSTYQPQQQQQQMYPAVPQPPPNSAPNPFLPSPRNSSTGVPSSSVMFAPERGMAVYPPSSVSYATAPSTLYVSAPLTSRSRYEGSVSGSSVNDGRYHLSPV